MKTIITIGALVLIISAGVLVIKRKKGPYLQRALPEGDKEEGPSPANFKKGCTDELRQIGRDFGFLYERTYLFINDCSLDDDVIHLFEDWADKINLYSHSYLKTTWGSITGEMSAQNDGQEIRTALKNWLAFLLGLGIKRSEDKEIKVQDDNIHHIYFIDEPFKTGDILSITRPAWFFEGKFVEKGIAVVKK